MQVALQTVTSYPPKGMCCVAWIGDALKDVLMDVLVDVLVDVLMCCIKTTNKKTYRAYNINELLMNY